jgi:hypothetical protein
METISMNNDSDIDIDLGNRNKLLEILDHIPAAAHTHGTFTKHPSGIYVTPIPYDPVKDLCSLHYQVAKERGYIKLDILNVNVYNEIRDEAHLLELMNREPNWALLQNAEFVEKIVQLNGHYWDILKMKDPIDSIPKMAMFLAMLRPSKRRLLGESWERIAKEIWIKDDEYTFKKSHAIAYSTLVVLHMNVTEDQILGR